MKIGIMQPYFIPYIGYFQLIKNVDKFVVYDKIEYSKGGWINRNRILKNRTDTYITLPLKKDSDYKPVNERELSVSWTSERNKMLNQIKESYRKAPFFKNTFPIVEEMIWYSDTNLFLFIENSIKLCCKTLEIDTPVVKSSDVVFDSELKGESKVIAIASALSGTVYINPIGGTGLYSKENFSKHNIQLQFIKSKLTEYKQFDNPFISALSIIDVMMFNSIESIKKMLMEDFSIV